MPVVVDKASCRQCVMRVLPDPGGPTIMMPCRTKVVSYSCTTLMDHDGCITRFSPSTTVVNALFSSVCSMPAGMPSAGKRSDSKDKNSGTSCATSLDRFMSRSVLISNA